MLMAFKLPALPPSVNQMYKINYRTKQMYLDKSVTDFKNKVYPLIPALKPPVERLRIEVEYYGRFLNKNGTIKRKDGQNLDKCLYDIIFEKFGLDDSIVWEGTWSKNHCEEEDYTLVKIYELGVSNE